MLHILTMTLLSSMLIVLVFMPLKWHHSTTNMRRQQQQCAQTFTNSMHRQYAQQFWPPPTLNSPTNTLILKSAMILRTQGSILLQISSYLCKQSCCTDSKLSQFPKSQVCRCWCFGTSQLLVTTFTCTYPQSYTTRCWNSCQSLSQMTQNRKLVAEFAGNWGEAKYTALISFKIGCVQKA